MESTEIQVVGEAIQAIVEALPLKTYLWIPSPMGTLPCAVIQPPSINRAGVLERESQLGSDDWDMSFPIVIYNDLHKAQPAQVRVVELVEALIKATDADPSLGGTVQDAKITSADVVYMQDDDRPLIGYDCTLDCLRLRF